MEDSKVEVKMNEELEIDGSMIAKNGVSETEEAIKDIGDAGGIKILSKDLGQEFARMSTDADAFQYNMNHPQRGYCIIFNHRYFDPHTQLGERAGTDRDKDQMNLLFSRLGFNVKVYENLTVNRIKEVLEKLSCGIEETGKHQMSDCLLVIFMSHGEDGVLYGRDGMFKVDDLFEQFKANQCPSLAGKPKMFFIQACRGEGLDAGTTLVRSNPRDETDSGNMSYRIPNSSDFLACFSTVPGHFSWRNTTNGSWFVQSIASVFAAEARHEDVLSMMTSVNRKMIINFESNCPSSPNMHGKKQTACIQHTLMRKIYLKPKH